CDSLWAGRALSRGRKSSDRRSHQLGTSAASSPVLAPIEPRLRSRAKSTRLAPAQRIPEPSMAGPTGSEPVRGNGPEGRAGPSGGELGSSGVVSAGGSVAGAEDGTVGGSSVGGSVTEAHDQ